MKVVLDTGVLVDHLRSSQPVSEAVARRAGDLERRWRRSHPGIGVADLAIAATVEQVDGTLATRNLKHFPMFKGLSTPY